MLVDPLRDKDDKSRYNNEYFAPIKEGWVDYNVCVHFQW